MNIYSDELLLDVRRKAEEVYGYDARIWRKIFARAWIRYDHYGMKDSFGWQIDHKKPQAQGGTDNITIFSRFSGKIIWKNQMIILFSTKITSRGNENVKERNDGKY